MTGSDPWHSLEANDAGKVFDGDKSTYFDGVGEGWVQADLGGLFDLKTICYCPRKGYEYRMPDSIFEVSADGVNWTNVHTVSALPDFSVHSINVDLGSPVRYVRYRVPEGAPQNSYNKDNIYCCNIAEIELYGLPADKCMGDVNIDGELSIADLVLLQEWLLGVPDTVLADWQAADFDLDGTLSILDLCAMRSALVR